MIFRDTKIAINKYAMERVISPTDIDTVMMISVDARKAKKTIKRFFL